MPDRVLHDASYKFLREANQAVEETIDMRPLVRSIVRGFDSLSGLGKEAVDLYRRVKGDSNKVRLMIEFFKAVNLCSQPEDDLPDDLETLEKMAEQVLKADD